MPSAGFLIYSGVMPLIKTYITMIAGYVVARMDLFPNAAARGASYVTMNMALPALIFGNVIPAFTPSNISALGPLFVVAFLYQVIGFAFGLIIREICYVPRNFWQGVIILTGMSNWGNLPTAVVLSVTEQAPFNSDTDPALGVSYVSIFIVAYYIVFFMLGAAHSISWDYLPRIPQGEAAERHVCWKEKPIGNFFARRILHQDVKCTFDLSITRPHDEEMLSEKVNQKTPAKGEATEIPSSEPDLEAVVQPNVDPDVQLVRKTSRLSTDPVQEQPRHASISYAPAVSSPVPPVPPPTPAQSVRKVNARSITSRSATLNTTLPQKIVRLFRPLSAVVTPVTIALVISLPISLINPLKALFVDISDISSYSFKGPDGRPPLAFLIDTANFVGSIAVPLALILLGASFARLRIPRPLSRLPIMAMLLSTLAKMVVLPVIGVFLVQAMTASGFVDRDAKVLRFVMIFLSCTPTAVNQLIVASLYSPDGNTDTLAAFLLVQYIFMFVSSSAVTAVALLLL